MRFMSFRLDARRGVVAGPLEAGRAAVGTSGVRVTLDDGHSAVLGPGAGAMRLLPGAEVSVILALRDGRDAIPVAVEDLATGRSVALKRLANLDRAWGAANLAASVASLACLPFLLLAGQGWAVAPLLATGILLLRFLRRVREYEAAIARLHARTAALPPIAARPAPDAPPGPAALSGGCVPAMLRRAA